jgi:Ankyrin repeats (3 copies)/Ankyrin repeats (many copies)
VPNPDGSEPIRSTAKAARRVLVVKYREADERRVGWDSLKKWFRSGPRSDGHRGAEPPAVRWLGPGESPWGVPVLDVRPVTLGMTSATSDQRCAVNAGSFAQDDGTGFIGAEPKVARLSTVGLKFRIDRFLADGALFLPAEMEHKWALYFHGGKIICIRSWKREVVAVADCRIAGDLLEIIAIRGALVPEGDEPQFDARVLDFLIRSHALDMIYPAPLPSGVESDPSLAAFWCMSCFGNRAHFATPHPLPENLPDKPLRTDSLLHIAVARGDSAEVRRLLDAGLPADLLARDGLAPLHWALAREDTSMLSLLLERGASVDARSIEGATPLMNAAQARSLQKVAFFLDHGADPNATDGRGFTTLHRAAEMGEIEIVRMLLDSGASPHAEAQGLTPSSLAAARGESAIVELLDSP